MMAPDGLDHIIVEHHCGQGYGSKLTTPNWCAPWVFVFVIPL